MKLQQLLKDSLPEVKLHDSLWDELAERVDEYYAKQPTAKKVVTVEEILEILMGTRTGVSYKLYLPEATKAAQAIATLYDAPDDEGKDLEEMIVQRILSLESQVDAPEILDQKRIECKLEAYREVLTYMEKDTPPPPKKQ